MSVKITYFVHGTTTDNENGISTGWLPGELSEKGQQQARELQKLVSDKEFDVVFCSDLKRAHDSANIVFGEKYKIIEDSRLRECSYGKLNGGLSSVVEPMQEGECIYNKFPEGESYEDVKTRVTNFLEFLKKNYDGKSVAIVSHKAPQLAIEVLLHGKTWEQALVEDWRKTKSWQPGWEYKLS